LPGEKGISPYEELTKRKPNLESFRPFGCLGMVHVHAGARKKLDKKYIPWVLLCNLDGRNYRMYDPKTQNVMVTRNVVFSEDKFHPKPGTEIDTLDILEEEAIDSDVSHDATRTTSDSQKRTTIYFPNQHREALKMTKMNSQMREIYLRLERKIMRKSKLHFLIGCIQIGYDSLLLDSYM
jgi:hypothetical protein